MTVVFKSKAIRINKSNLISFSQASLPKLPTLLRVQVKLAFGSEER